MGELSPWQLEERWALIPAIRRNIVNALKAASKQCVQRRPGRTRRASPAADIVADPNLRVILKALWPESPVMTRLRVFAIMQHPRYRPVGVVGTMLGRLPDRDVDRPTPCTCMCVLVTVLPTTNEYR